MRVLVTGDRGAVGGRVAGFLAGCGYQVAGFDLADGADVLDLAALRRAARGCAAIVHLAALAHDSAGSPEQIMAVNVLGTWNVLLAAEAAGAGRVICFSSAQVFGIAEGERLPDYFPVDDAHPRRAMRPYGLSKKLAEDLCEGFTARTGIPAMSLRPVAVWDEARYARLQDRWHAQPQSQWEPFWEYGAFVDVRDVAAAVHQALTVPLAGHYRALLCAADIAATAPSLQLATRLAPACRSPTRAATAPIPGPPSSTAQPPPLRSAGGPPTDGPSRGTTDPPSHNTPRGMSGTWDALRHAPGNLSGSPARSSRCWPQAGRSPGFPASGCARSRSPPG